MAVTTRTPPSTNRLARDLEFSVLIFLSVDDLDSAMEVSKYWYAFINDPARWKDKYKNKKQEEIKNIQKKNTKSHSR